MEFTTKVKNITQRHFRFEDKFVLIGSCFTEHIAQKMEQAFMQICVNPFGILYNPASIAQCLDILFSGKLFTESDLIFHDGLYHSLLHHGKFSEPTIVQTLDNINSQLTAARHFIADLQPNQDVYFIITFGTACVYLHNNQIVSNCHKIPESQFTRRFLTIDEITQQWQQLIVKHDILQHSLFTVSPVRYIKDGLHQSQLSKATLLLALNNFAANNYFPSYEIVVDELRDYRFYDADMVHVSDVAIEYVWQQFQQNCFTPAACRQIDEAMSVRRLLEHRILHPNTDNTQMLSRQKKEKFDNLKHKYPWIENYSF